MPVRLQPGVAHPSRRQYRDLRSDVMPALTAARDRLIELVDNPQGIQDTSTIALAALALGVGSTGNPFEVNA
jgi:hypothetical protein